jgi:hypothetical protein
MSGERIKELVLYNEMQIQLVENINEYMGVVLTPEKREELKESFISLRHKILNTQSILYNIQRRQTIGKHVNVFLPNILNALIVGERGTGKSAYIKSLKGNDFDRRYLRTENEPHLIYQQHSDPDKSLGCYFNFRLLTDIDRNPNPPELFEYANVAFIFYSVDSRPTYMKIHEWIDKILSVVPNCKIFICANMVDKGIRLLYIPNPYRNSFNHTNVEYLQIPLSTRTGANIHNPINKTLEHFESVGLIHQTKIKTHHLYYTFERDERLKSKYNGLSELEKIDAIREEWKKYSWSNPYK